MTSVYVLSLSNVRSINLGPLNSRKAPNITRVVNRGIVYGNPPQFFSQQEPINANMNSIYRNQYLRTPTHEMSTKKIYKDTTSTDRLRRLKSQSIGNNIHGGKLNSTKNFNQNDMRSAIRRMRSSGYVVPNKK